MVKLQSYAVAASTLLPVASATVTAGTSAVCSYLYNKYPGYVVYDPLGTQGLQTIGNATLYSQTSTEYWNVHSDSNRAACMFFPSTAQQVSDAVKKMNQYPDVPFGLKSGGHNPNLGYSSTDSGVLISFRPNMNYTKPSADLTAADVGPGTRWGEATTVLQQYNKAVVGGRLGHIGVSGFTLGGGLSYLSAQYGLACDNVVDYEVVLANGTITHATATQNKDLFWALHGGGNQYAIVTNFKLKLHPIGTNGKIYGGIRLYSVSDASKVLTAVSNFVNLNTDPKAAIIPTVDLIGPANAASTMIVFFFYDGASAPSGIFDNFNSITPLVDNVQVQTYDALVNSENGGYIPGYRYQIRVNSFPNMPIANMSTFLTQHYNQFYQSTLVDSVDLDITQFTFAVQPMPVMIQKAMGDNALGLNPANGDKIWIEYDMAWLSPICDNTCPGYVAKIANQLHDFHAQNYAGIYPTKYQSGDLQTLSYNPLFMNDAMYDQPVLQSYGQTNYQRLKSIAKAFDPAGFLATRQGGFKFTT